MSSKALPQTPVEELDVLNEAPVALNDTPAPLDCANFSMTPDAIADRKRAYAGHLFVYTKSMALERRGSTDTVASETTETTDEVIL